MTYDFPHAFDQRRYPQAYLRTGLLEDAVQKSVLLTLRGMGCVAFTVDAGAKHLRGRAFGALKKAGLPPAVLFGKSGAGMSGLSDIVGVTSRGRALFIEVKAPAWLVPSEKRKGRLLQKRRAGQPSREQLEFLATVHRSHAIAGVVWSATDARDLYRNQGAP